MKMLYTGTKWDNVIQELDPYRYIIPKAYRAGMNVDALIISSPELIEHVCTDLSIEQAVNVATLPGILKHSLAMPDMHQGYGFPIGGVAAMDINDGVVSPGGVGFDINCGVRLLASSLSRETIKTHLEELVDALFKAVPSGAGPTGRIHLSEAEMDQVLQKGSLWAVENGYAQEADLEHTEEGGLMRGANPSCVSAQAKKRGSTQLGTLGSGNHFLEVQIVDEIFEPDIARAFGLSQGQVCFMIHCGSRGLGHQVCTDFLARLKPVTEKYNINLPDRELACVPIQSPEGKEYLAAMASAANFAFANRQCISFWVKEVVERIFGSGTELSLVYDVAHNMAKFETHKLNEHSQTVLVHRKGATRAFPKGHPDLPQIFAEFGHPVIIPGDMGRASYVLVGTEKALKETFGSVCHGAGRLMSRTQARKGKKAKEVVERLRQAGIIAKASSREGLTEEVPEAYKPIDQVINAVQQAGLAQKVARLKPIGVIKG